MTSLPTPHPFPPPLTLLTEQIASQTALVQAYLSTAGHPEPSYTAASREAEEEAERGFRAIAEAPAEVADAKTKAIEACLELAETLMGPREMLMPDVGSLFDFSLSDVEEQNRNLLTRMLHVLSKYR